MSVEDQKELNRLLENDHSIKAPRCSPPTSVDDSQNGERRELGGLNQWSSSDNVIFVPTSYTQKSLTSGFYTIRSNPSLGLYFEKLPIKTENLLKFPDSNSEKIVSEIQNFWELENRFKQYGLSYKRGILLWGPPGSGKSCTIKQIMDDVIKRDGVVIEFTHPTLFKEGYRIFRQIQPETPCIVSLEDIDSILDNYSESEVINIIDGVERIHKTVFLATTNYPERLGERIINRPSRFDKKFKIGVPNDIARKIYFESLFKQNENLKYNINKWVEDTEGLSIAHLKELFIAVVVLGDDYKESIETLQGMSEHIDSKHDIERHIGFKKNR